MEVFVGLLGAISGHLGQLGPYVILMVSCVLLGWYLKNITIIVKGHTQAIQVLDCRVDQHALELDAHDKTMTRIEIALEKLSVVVQDNSREIDRLRDHNDRKN